MSKTRSKTERIRELLSNGVAVADIVKSLKVSRALVYRIKQQIIEEEASKPTIVTRKDLAHDDLVGTDVWAVERPDDVMFRIECTACKRPMWTNSTKADLCQDDAWILMQEAAERSIERSAPREHNAFAEPEGSSGSFIIPGDPYRLI